MQTRKEVTEMYAAITRFSTVMAIVTTFIVGAAMAQTIAPGGEPARMPGGICPPNC